MDTCECVSVHNQGCGVLVRQCNMRCVSICKYEAVFIYNIHVFVCGQRKSACACVQMYTSNLVRLLTHAILHLCNEPSATRA